MLRLLKINNLALVEDLVWETGTGLIGITGETGAGKSVIVGALKLVVGERANQNLVRTGCDSCSIEAVFDLLLLETRGLWAYFNLSQDDGPSQDDIILAMAKSSWQPG